MKSPWENRKFWFWLMVINSIALILFKYPDLSLPYFWDESYPYSFAIKYLYDNNLSLMPSAIPQDYSTGHPTLFYFLAAGWGKIFGPSLFSFHSFALLISLLAQWSVFSLGKRIVNPAVGCAASIMMTWQSTFLAQSGFLLPEVMLCLWLTLSLNAWISKKYLMYFLSASAAVLTKESGFLVAFTIGIWVAADHFFITKNEKSVRHTLKKILIAASPVLTFAAFFIVQKIQMGWFFFPRHFNKVEGDLSIIFSRAAGFWNRIFLSYGRIFSLGIAGISLVILFLKGNINKEKISNSLPFILYPFFLICFSMLNFYSSTRYLLSIFPLLFLGIAYLTWAASKQNTKMLSGLWVLMTLVPLLFTIFIRLPKDDNLGFRDAIHVQRQATQFCEENGWHERQITTQFIYLFGFRDPHTGYLIHPEKPFTKVSAGPTENPDIFVFYNSGVKKIFQEWENKVPMKVLKRFESGNSWAEVRIKIQDTH